MDSNNSKTTFAVIAVIAILVVGSIAFFAFGSSDDSSSQSSNQSEQSSSDSSSENSGSDSSSPDYIEGANVGETVDATGKEELELEINDFIFQETIVTVSKGTKVTWTNKGSAQHDVTSDESSPNKGLESELLANGESYSFTFDEAGTYNYFCTPHPAQMKAVIEVVE